MSDTAVTTATPSLKTSACQSLATIRASLAKLATEAKNVTVGQVKAAQQKIGAAVASLASKIPRSDTPILNSLKAANTDLTNALSGYPDSTTLGEVLPAVPAYENLVAQAQAAEAKLSSKLHCSA
jgi:hypothetical protein